MDDDFADAAIGVLAIIGVIFTVIFGTIWVIVWLVKAAAWVFISFWPLLLAAGVIIGAVWWFWLMRRAVPAS